MRAIDKSNGELARESLIQRVEGMLAAIIDDHKIPQAIRELKFAEALQTSSQGMWPVVRRNYDRE
jgi:uncharacterized protein (UPF0147 family)